jgi:hypothetical protein
MNEIRNTCVLQDIDDKLFEVNSSNISHLIRYLTLLLPSSLLPCFYPSAALIGENILYFGGGANNSNGVSVLKIGASSYGKYSVCGTDIIIDDSDLAIYLFFILLLFLYRLYLEK